MPFCLAGVEVYVAASAGATSERTSIATIASSFVRLCSVDQLVKAMLTLEMIGMTTNAIRKTVPGTRYLSGISRRLGTK